MSCRILGNISRYFQGFITVFFPLWLPVHADGPISTFFTNGLIVGLFAALGHVYPVYLKFQGGKAVATSAGVVLGVNPILLRSAIIFFIVLKIFKYVSLASIVAAICCVIGSLIIQDYILLVVSFIVSIILIIRHRSNIARIFRGEEPKIKWM